MILKPCGLPVPANLAYQCHRETCPNKGEIKLWDKLENNSNVFFVHG
jgi:hypothetical protein